MTVLMFVHLSVATCLLVIFLVQWREHRREQWNRYLDHAKSVLMLTAMEQHFDGSAPRGCCCLYDESPEPDDCDCDNDDGIRPIARLYPAKFCPIHGEAAAKELASTMWRTRHG